MKVCLISFDYWEFDRHITNELQRRQGIEASHIDLSTFKYAYPGPLHRLGNMLNKLLFKKNIKKEKRQEYAVQQLEALGHQDIVLVIRPDLLDKNTHMAIKANTDKYIAYLYDSTKRFPVTELLDGVFDAVFSFDEEDVKQYGFTHIANYIYLPQKAVRPVQEFDYRVFIVISADERLPELNAIAQELDKLQVRYKFMVKASSRPAGLVPGIEHTSKEIRPNALLSYLDTAEVFLDIVRHGHNGLSFRVFEALAYQRKLITTNPSIKNYDFYDPNNILVIDPQNIVICPDFFATPYKPLPESIYHKYTIAHWVDTVFFTTTNQICNDKIS